MPTVPYLLKIGTRGSKLAMAQTAIVLERLQIAWPQIAFEVKEISTRGDRDQQTSLGELGGQGVFVKAIEQALLDGEIDLAIHSLKDMPSEQPQDLVLGAVLPREDPRDALVSPNYASLDALPAGARVGTGSLRRQAQLRALRPELNVIGIRGNVDTRLRKVRTESYDAVLLAVAGLRRLKRAGEITETLPIEIMLPAVGQGAIAVQVRAKDTETTLLMSTLNDPSTRTAVTAERGFLRAIGGGCRLPMAAYAIREGKELHLRGLLANPDGSRLLRDEIRGALIEAESLGRNLAQRLLQKGGAALITEEDNIA